MTVVVVAQIEADGFAYRVPSRVVQPGVVQPLVHERLPVFSVEDQDAADAGQQLRWQFNRRRVGHGHAQHLRKHRLAAPLAADEQGDFASARDRFDDPRQRRRLGAQHVADIDGPELLGGGR